MKIVSFKICPFVQRVTAILEAKNAAYDVEYINLSNKPDWFLKMSPNAQVPILITEKDEVLFESDAIVEYIEEVILPPLFSPDPAKKARERAWSYLASKHYLVQCSSQRSRTKEVLVDRSEKLSNAFAKLENALDGSTFFSGDAMGMVDIAWLPILHRSSIIEKHSGYDFIDKFVKIKTWQQNILSTGIAEKSVAGDFEEKFCAFYLSEETYLGQCTKSKMGQSCCGETECSDPDFECCS